MFNGWNQNYSFFNGMFFPEPILKILLPFVLFDIVLRGLALWRSARNGQNIWFIFLLIVNSLGLLPAVYLLTNKEIVRKPAKKK